MNIPYNTKQERVRLFKYGRHVQELIEKACQLPDAAQRQAAAQKIILVMQNINPDIHKSPNYKQTLWNHLAFISGYNLDINYPCEIENVEESPLPNKLSYPGHRIRYRHYGYMLEETISKICSLKDDPKRKEELIGAAANIMGRDLAEWRGVGVEEDKIARDLENYTKGIVTEDEALDIIRRMPQRAWFSTKNRHSSINN